ncbi:MAG: TlpA family protein disulfide reductase [Atopostipes suicloacalis]|nr:TlpA family protein disulfide reductase [Atopostipes suicloacalis]MDN6730667.1 TlpA family protein disulfide reductase [Atopostipes suicloacalis]
MNKKTSRNIILLIIAAAVIFVVFDFVNDTNKEDAAREAASQPEESLVEENEEFKTKEETNFSAAGENNEEISEEEPEENNNSPQMSYGANIGDTAYDYELTDIETGEQVKLSDYRGQKVFLNFWASWCPPCRVEAPHLEDFSNNQDEVVVLGVNVKVSESSEENVVDFIDEFGLTFPNVYGPEEMFGPFFVESLPSSFFIDSEGIIRDRVTGPVTEDTLHAVFEMID